MAPAIDRSWATDQPLPVNLFDVSADREPLTVDDWYSLGCASPKLMILPSNGTFNHLATLPKIGRLRVPNRDAHEEALRRLVGDGWFVVLHYREPSYELRLPDPNLRDANLEHIQPIVDRVISLGGQVVRVGHPQMTTLKDQQGFIDLKDVDFLLQAHAIARARCFFEATPSGPSSLAMALGVPLARCNGSGMRCIIKGMGFVVPQRVIHKSGQDLTHHLIETEQIEVRAIQANPDLRYQQLELSDLFDALDRILNMTKDATNRWRDDTPPPPTTPIPGFYPGAAQTYTSTVIL
ncbi:TIGR04372 family glycosyltransferase [Alphaproteobacteria bacterium]|nr:TIGR04372 family glycosyltransferase [Alphaproteobacteria bacterium]